MPHPAIPTLVIAGTASGVGKTTVVAGLLAALRRRGLHVQPFKCGPDYIDPGYHSEAAGTPCRNLDAWMLDDGQVQAAFTRACRKADAAIVEGVMGLFDGSDFQSERASAAHIAKLLGAPVVIVLDISGAGRSTAATALGFLRFDPSLNVAGFILNLAGSDAHAQGCAAVIAKETGKPVFGWLVRDKSLGIPERHLGLVLQGGHPGGGLMERLADAVEAHTDLTALLRAASTARTPLFSEPVIKAAPGPNHRPILAVARDEAFAFYYPDNLELLEAAGADIRFFSPIAGERLPAGAAGVYLGGGYPELHGGALANNEGLGHDLRELKARKAPIYAECGGFMALTEALVDLDGRRWPMFGLVPGEAHMTPQIAGLGYREATALSDNLLVAQGTTVRGHEFHHSRWVISGSPHSAAWQLRGTGSASPAEITGYASGNLLASYLHVHFGQSPALAPSFVRQLRSPTV